jgi:hypothetical protein
MAPETGTALLVLVAFVLPGFVALLISERTHLVRVPNRSPFELLLIATYYSVVCWGIIALSSWPFQLSRDDVREMYREDDLGKLAALSLVALLVVPALVATAARLWARSGKWRPRVLRLLRVHTGHRVPTAWDWMWGQRKPALVRAVLSDGRIVAGYYGSQSFPGYGTESQDVLLEARWTLDKDYWFLEETEGSHGLWLSAGSIISLELYDPPHEPATGQAVTEEGRAPATEGQEAPESAAR